MSADVTFRATDDQLRELVGNLIEASGCDRPYGPTITLNPKGSFPVLMDKWQGKHVAIIIVRSRLHPGAYRMLHTLGGPYDKRAWAAKYPTAEDAVSSVLGIEIIESLDAKTSWERSRASSFLKGL